MQQKRKRGERGGGNRHYRLEGGKTKFFPQNSDACEFGYHSQHLIHKLLVVDAQGRYNFFGKKNYYLLP